MKSGILVALLAAGAGAFWWWPPAPAAAKTPGRGDVTPVRRGDLRITIAESGTMVAKQSQKVQPKLDGEGKITFLVEEGKDVQEGEVVCRLDPTAVQGRVDQAQLEMLQAEASLKAARTELEIQEGDNTANTSKAKVGLERAQKELEKYRDGEAPQQRKKLEVAIKDAETAFNRSAKNLADSKKLLEQNFIKKSELEDHQIEFERATVQKEGAELELRLFEKYTQPMQLADLGTKVEDAGREVANAEKRAGSLLDQKRVNVQVAEKRLKALQDQLKERNEELANMTLKAPCPGIVVYGDPHEPWYRERVKVGGQVWGGQPVMTIPDLRVMQVKIQVHEADIDQVRLGLPAIVTMDTYRGLALKGEVTRIASVATSDNAWGGSREVKKFDVEVTVRGEPGAQTLRPGISAKVEIEVDTKKQVLFVPLQCVFAEGEAMFSYVQPTGAAAPVRRKVKTGASNQVHVEVLEGLAEQESVLLYNPLLPPDEHPGGTGKAGAGETAPKTADAAAKKPEKS